MLAVAAQRQLGIALLEDRVHEPLHRARIFPFGEGAVGFRVGGRIGGPLVQDDAQARRTGGGAHRLHRQPVRHQEMVRHLHALLQVGHPRRELGIAVAEIGRAPGFVVGGDRRDAVAEAALDLVGVVGKAVRGVAVQPAAFFLQGLRQVPVIQGQVGRDVFFGQGVEQAVVEAEAGLVPGAFATRLHARPGHREAVGVHVQAGQQVHVVAVAVVMVAGDLAVAAILDGAGPGAEAVPDRGALAVGGRGAFDLEGAGGRAPGEVAGKLLG